MIAAGNRNVFAIRRRGGSGGSTPPSPFYLWSFVNAANMRGDSINGLTLEGTISGANFLASSREGSGLWFNSTGSYMLSSAPLVNKSFTINFWYKSEILTSGTNIIPARFADIDGNWVEVEILDAVDSDGRLDVNITASGGASMTATILEDTWACISVAVTGGTKIEAVIDSGDTSDPQFVSSTTSIPNSTTGYYMRNVIGGTFADNQGIEMDHLAIWKNQVLNQAKMEYLAQGYFWNAWDNERPLNSWQTYP